MQEYGTLENEEYEAYEQEYEAYDTDADGESDSDDAESDSESDSSEDEVTAQSVRERGGCLILGGRVFVGVRWACVGCQRACER